MYPRFALPPIARAGGVSPGSPRTSRAAFAGPRTAAPAAAAAAGSSTNPMFRPSMPEPPQTPAQPAPGPPGQCSGGRRCEASLLVHRQPAGLQLARPLGLRALGAPAHPIYPSEDDPSSTRKGGLKQRRRCRSSRQQLQQRSSRPTPAGPTHRARGPEPCLVRVHGEPQRGVAALGSRAPLGPCNCPCHGRRQRLREAGGTTPPRLASHALPRARMNWQHPLTACPELIDLLPSCLVHLIAAIERTTV